MTHLPISFQQKFEQFTDHWSPKIVAQMNDYHFKLVKLQGEFVWHSHPATDEVFIVMQGEMVLRFRDRDIPLKSGEMFIVPKGVEHMPVAEQECQVMLVEPAGTLNTGDAGGEKTAIDGVWI